jgi:hypothetical protein
MGHSPVFRDVSLRLLAESALAPSTGRWNQRPSLTHWSGQSSIKWWREKRLSICNAAASAASTHESSSVEASEAVEDCQQASQPASPTRDSLRRHWSRRSSGSSQMSADSNQSCSVSSVSVETPRRGLRAPPLQQARRSFGQGLRSSGNKARSLLTRASKERAARTTWIAACPSLAAQRELQAPRGECTHHIYCPRHIDSTA